MEGFNQNHMDDTLEAIGLYAHGILKKAGDILPLLKHDNYKIPTLLRPTKPKKKTLPANATQEELDDAQDEFEVDKALWTERLKLHALRLEQLTENKCAIYDIAWGQCSPDLRSKLHGHEGFIHTEETQDLTTLLQPSVT